MATDLSSKTVLVVSGPLYVSLAERLARDFAKVYLHVPIAGSYPHINKGLVGYGLPGVELVNEIDGPHLDEADLVVFPDLYHPAAQVRIEEMGKRVWGSRHGEDLECKRELCKKLMEKEGLPVQPWKVLHGLKALRAHLKAHDGQHVKIDRWRGVTESFFAENYETVAPKLDQLAASLGAFQEVLDFIVEDDLPDRVEIGLDTYCIDGAYPDLTLCGLEVKDLGFTGQFVPWKAIPEPLRRWNEAMAPYLEQAGFRGSLSNEIRIGKDKEPFMIDATCRMPSPPGELWQEIITNLAEVLWSGAGGEVAEPIPAGKFGVEVILKSAFAEDNHQPVEIPEQFERNVKLYNSILVDGRRYVVPQGDQMTEIGAVIGWGDTLEAAVAMAQEAGESVKGYGIKFGMGPIDNATEQMAELADLGVSPFEMDKFPAPP